MAKRFFGYLAIEKLIKAVFVQKKKKEAPLLHSLAYLCELANINLDEQKRDAIIKINKFNLSIRYPDDIEEFKKIYTREYAAYWLNKIKEIYLWLQQQIT